MKEQLLAAAVLFSASLPANADVRFTGALTTLKATNCAYTTVGDRRSSAYRPPGQAGNPNNGGLTMLYHDGGYAIEFNAALAPLNTFQTVVSVEFGGFGFDVYSTRVKFAVRTPATVTAATRSVYLKGTIEEPFGEKFSPGLCVVDFEASLVRRP